LSSILVIDLGKKFGLPRSKKIRLSKIRSGDQWRRLVAALRYRCVCPVELDETLLDGHDSGTQHDPTYTKLWYEALTAAPQRTRLLPLSAGANLQNGAYRIEQQIGTGGQGTAYLATANVPTASKVVLKEYILPVYVDVKVRVQALESFKHEALMLCSLKHPSIVSMLDSFIEDHRAYLVLEYVNGRSVREGVLAEGPLPEATCINMGMVMCDILQYLHSQTPPIVHQDFTPDNLLVSENGKLKLIDFMVAKQESVDTSTSTVVGKHHYMPPEQFRGKSTTQSDIYALGATLYFMLTGQDPEPMSQLHVSGSLDPIISRATALDTAQRYASAQEVKADLQQLLAVSPLT
jgi:serine/threonine-protein kinase